MTRFALASMMCRRARHSAGHSFGDTPTSWRSHHAEIVAHRSQQMHRLSAMRDGLFLRALPEHSTSKSRIKVFNFEHEGRKVPYTCTQCAEAWCMNACPVDAIRHRCRHRRQGGVHGGPASAARCAPSPARSARSTTWPTPARCRSATSAAATPPAPRPARPPPSPTSMPTGPGSTRCAWAAKTNTQSRASA
jgi:ferredoxin